jgi:DNA topoisomerase IB
VCRSCYVHPAIPDAYLSGELHDVWKRSRATAGFSRSERTTLKLLER